MAGGVFHVEFGFNDTPLTRALESGLYKLAEQLICDTTNPSALDEGCYQRTPLYICLCGLDMDDTRPKPRNLHLAKLLIERGANVNYRVPTTYFGCEYSGPGKTPLELLVDFYTELTGYGRPDSQACWPGYADGWDSKIDSVIGLNKQHLTSLVDVLEHLEDLVFIILAVGGDANIQDEMRKTPLHKLAVFSEDERLFKVLCDNGANINTVDCRGNSPLLSLCDLSASEMYEYMEDLSPSSTDTLEDTRANLCVKKEFLNFILQQKSLQIDIQNNIGHTALFHCVIRGDSQAVNRLILEGANTSVRATVWETRKRKRRISPIFATFLSIPLQRTLNWKTMHSDTVKAPRQYSQLVDKGFFERREIADEICDMLTGDFKEFSHLKSIAPKMCSLMFGQTTATLRQLATRSLFNQCFIKQQTSMTNLIPNEAIKDSLIQESDVPSSYEEYIQFILNRSVLQLLISTLGLPRDSLVNFEVELLLHRIANKLSSMKAMPPENIFCDSDGDVSDLSESDATQYSEEGGDSDLEYW